MSPSYTRNQERCLVRTSTEFSFMKRVSSHWLTILRDLSSNGGYRFQCSRDAALSIALYRSSRGIFKKRAALRVEKGNCLYSRHKAFPRGVFGRCFAEK